MTEREFICFLIGACFSIYSVIALYRDKHGIYDVTIGLEHQQYQCKEAG